MRIDRLPRGKLLYMVATFPHEGQFQAQGSDAMNHPDILTVADANREQKSYDAPGSVILAAWRGLQQLFASLCEPAQSTVTNPAAYPATFINLP
jgi:hypothetical protein